MLLLFKVVKLADVLKASSDIAAVSLVHKIIKK